MANDSLTPAKPPESVPSWRVPKVLLDAAVRSSSLLGHDLIHRFTVERFQLFLAAYFAFYFGAGVVLSLWQYACFLKSGWFLAIAAISTAQCVVLAVALALARRARYQQSITLACIGNWIAVFLITAVAPNLLPAMVLAALVPVVFAQPYMRWQRGLLFAVITAGCVLALATVARFQHFAHSATPPPRWIEHAFIVIALPLNAFHILVIAWNNAAALAVSESMLAERAAEVEASRGRLVTAADEERRRLERDLHDGAQQYLVSLAVIIQLARKAENGKHQPLLAEATGLLDDAIAEIRRLAHGIYPPSLVTGGLAQALSSVAAHSPVPIHLDLKDLGRYPPSTEAALYFCCNEALQNAAKHGGPDTTITIAARTDAQTLSLTISDTGPGFEPATVGTGLTNMTDRVSAIGGTLTIDTAPGRGTRITAVVETAAQAHSDQPGTQAGAQTS
jgi:signal transduction histidine kinase